MSKLYLVTGFLGAGKTTFLKRLVRLFPGQKLQIIVNEFGKEGVDGALLAELGACLQEISGGSVFCACRLDRFEAVLRQSAELAPDIILVEASGLSDPTGVRKLFDGAGRFPHIQYMGGICLVDAVRFPKLYATARACVRQLAASDVAVVNKADLADGTQLADTLALIRGQRPDMPILQTSFGAVDAALLDLLERARLSAPEDMPLTADLTTGQLNVRLADSITIYDLRKFIEMFLEDTYRVKGFLQTADAGLVLVDCVGTLAAIGPYALAVPKEKIGWLTVLFGAGTHARRAVLDACVWYQKNVLSVE